MCLIASYALHKLSIRNVSDEDHLLIWLGSGSSVNEPRKWTRNFGALQMHIKKGPIVYQPDTIFIMTIFPCSLRWISLSFKVISISIHRESHDLTDICTAFQTEKHVVRRQILWDRLQDQMNIQAHPSGLLQTIPLNHGTTQWHSGRLAVFIQNIREKLIYQLNIEWYDLLCSQVTFIIMEGDIGATCAQKLDPTEDKKYQRPHHEIRLLEDLAICRYRRFVRCLGVYTTHHLIIIRKTQKAKLYINKSIGNRFKPLRLQKRWEFFQRIRL